MQLVARSTGVKDFNVLQNNGKIAFQHIPHDLRPTAAQRAIPHHPYIDLIPWPTFRTKVLQAKTMTPSLLDEDDLLQECKAQNTRLIEYFGRGDVLKKLLGYVTGQTESEEKGRFKCVFERPSLSLSLSAGD